MELYLGYVCEDFGGAGGVVADVEATGVAPPVGADDDWDVGTECAGDVGIVGGFGAVGGVGAGEMEGGDGREAGCWCCWNGEVRMVRAGGCCGSDWAGSSWFGGC